MPTKQGKDSKGSFYQWGSGKKHYYTTGNKASRDRAKSKANKQGEAIYSNGYKG